MKQKPTIQAIPVDLLERIYAEVEGRVERKFRQEIRELKETVTDLKKELGYQRRRADRLSAEVTYWRKKYYKEQERSEKAEGQLSLALTEIKTLKSTVAEQQKDIAKLRHRLYSRKAEATSKASTERLPEPKKSRGRQPGAKGNGRKKRTNLETVERISDFKEEELCCPGCRKPYEYFAETATEQIHYELKLVRVIHKRKKIRKKCQCANTPMIKTAPAPLQLFRGSLFDIDFWQMILMEKYLLQRPLNRILQSLSLHGLDVSQGTITNALKRLHDRKIFEPLLNGIKSRLQQAVHWQMDETGWKVFQETEGKTGFNWWLWVALTKDCCLYTLDPTRSGDVPRRILGEDPLGVCTSDRYSAYSRLGPSVQNSWCWAHLRRDILSLQVGSPTHAKFVEAWIERVDRIFHLNNNRVSAQTQSEFGQYDDQLRTAMNDFKRRVFALAKDSRVNEDFRKTFGSIVKSWDGYYLFVDHPSIPMDNNASERALRNSVVGRKNYYGSGSQWSGELAAQLFTLYETFKMNGLDPRATMLEYLYAVAEAGGKPPPDAESFLPWNSPTSKILQGLTSDAP